MSASNQKARWPRYPLWWLFVAITVSAVFLAAYSLIRRNLESTFGIYVGPVSVAEGWPVYFQFIHDNFPELSSEQVSLYSIEYEDFLDSEYILAIPASTELLELLEEQWRLEPLDNSKVSPQFWKMPTKWWPTIQGVNDEFFMSPGFLPIQRGKDGDYALLMHDKDRGMLFIWYKFNF